MVMPHPVRGADVGGIAALVVAVQGPHATVALLTGLDDAIPAKSHFRLIVGINRKVLKAVVNGSTGDFFQDIYGDVLDRAL